MLMLDRAHVVTRQCLAAIPTPDRTASWRPVGHLEVISRLTEQAHARGLRIVNERLALKDGAYSPRPGVRVALRGARLFGTFDFAPLPHLPVAPGCQPSIGIVNSCDQTKALRFLCGLRVLVCSNGLAVGEVDLRRKHTAGLDLAGQIEKALDEFVRVLTRTPALVESLRATQLTRNRAYSTILRLAQAGAFRAADTLRVAELFDHPPHPEFEGRTLWNLLNAATETMKRQSPSRQVRAHRILSQVLLRPVLN